MPSVTVFDRAERSTDRHGGVADVELRRVGEGHRGEVRRVDLDDREVDRRVGADELALVDTAVRGRHRDGAARAVTVERHHVGVRDDVAVLVQDDAGTGAGFAARRDVDRDDRGGGLRGDRGDDRGGVVVVDGQVAAALRGAAAARGDAAAGRRVSSPDAAHATDEAAEDERIATTGRMSLLRPERSRVAGAGRGRGAGEVVAVRTLLVGGVTERARRRRCLVGGRRRGRGAGVLAVAGAVLAVLALLAVLAPGRTGSAGRRPPCWPYCPWPYWAGWPYWPCLLPY